MKKLGDRGLGMARDPEEAVHTFPRGDKGVGKDQEAVQSWSGAAWGGGGGQIKMKTWC